MRKQPAKPKKSVWFAEPQIYKGTRFDSMFELKVFQLLEAYPFKVERQVRLEVKPKTETMPSMYWKVDFQITHPSTFDFLLIEAKGRQEDRFIIQYQLLNYFEPLLFAKLLVVSDRKSELICRGFYSQTFQNFKSIIRDFYHGIPIPSLSNSGSNGVANCDDRKQHTKPIKTTRLTR